MSLWGRLFGRKGDDGGHEPPSMPWDRRPSILEAALWAFHDAASFEEAVLKAVNLGEDADTTGAICGQLAGAFWGESSIPEPLRSGLARMDMIENALAGFLGASNE